MLGVYLVENGGSSGSTERSNALRSVILTEDLESGGYTVEVPSLSGCFSEGDTVEEALANIKQAIEGFEVMRIDLGEEVPQEGPTILVA